MKKEIEHCKCPYCKSTVEIDVEFAIKNERIFCGGCCKAFDIKIEKTTQDTKEEPSDVEKILMDKYKERKEEKVEEIEHSGAWDDYDGFF